MLAWLRHRGRATAADAGRRAGGPPPVRLHGPGDARDGRRRRRGDPRRRVAADRRLGPSQRRAVRAGRTGRSAGSSTTPSRSPQREVRRGRRYAGIVLDPPSYGHGPGARPWRLEDDLPRPARRPAPRLLEPGRVRAADGAHARLRGRSPGAACSRARVGDPGRATLERRRARARDRRRARSSSSAPSRGRPAGHDVADARPRPPVLTSLANPRIKAAAALRERRERDRTGLTLVDGARELRRALDAGVDVVEAFVCEPLLAGPDARAALDRLRAGAGRRSSRSSETVFAKLAFGERAEGLVAVVRIPSARARRPRAAGRPARRRRRGRREARATSGAVLRSRRRRRAPTPSSPPRRGPTSSTRTPSGRAPGRSSRVPLAAATDRRGRSPGCAGRGLRIVAARVDAATGLHRRRPDRARRARAAAPRPRACRTPGRGAGRRGGPPADARRRRQPQRVGQRGDPAVRGTPPARPIVDDGRRPAAMRT